ncbi:MAG: hypothetical protein OFPII_07540 [Osedax symbiont Rs1]|nr:MAG: hypothetical protein OFPII_07540 [Osedax symbiont Rs1]
MSYWLLVWSQLGAKELIISYQPRNIYGQFTTCDCRGGLKIYLDSFYLAPSYLAPYLAFN